METGVRWAGNKQQVRCVWPELQGSWRGTIRGMGAALWTVLESLTEAGGAGGTACHPEPKGKGDSGSAANKGLQEGC